ncbi:fibronectin type III domain-containing protein [Chryseosolibacter indicus]|uniref:Fibronectin type-III domain-containing protein n=1 Tax=Chryseosolibacter indicus TaxID=2782351 RepID=A0ABS5VZ22_9BACT|nr:hypothetical protein [Chryseosolibacter indicus]MBT1706117.1 hypothetical protein [Chryseosolibacter indicus]
MTPFFRVILLVFSLIFIFTVSSYTQVLPQPPAVAVMSKADSSFIKLRWAATNPVLWQKSNKSGFVVEKFLLVRNNKLLGNPVKINRYEIKLWPLERWEPLAKQKRTERWAAIALQAIYGKHFNVQSTGSSQFYTVMTRVQDQEMRYSFALMSADYSFEVAQAMGIGLQDKDVKKDEKYLYKVYFASTGNTKTDTAYTVVGLEDYMPLPEPLEVGVQFGSRAATISWNTEYHEHIYTGYYIERSEDGIHFKQLSDIPITRPVKENQRSSDKVIYKTDTLPANGVVYHYRVVGLTPFGETGPPSKIVSGQGKEAFTAMPVFERPVIQGNKVSFHWYFFDEQDKSLVNIKGFDIERSILSEGPYQPIYANKLLSPSERDATDSLKEGTHYYRLKILDKNENAFYSFAQLVQAPDSIPPAIPASLTGIADTSGTVSLHWQNVVDKDLLGYKVFRSNHQHAEYTLITPSPIQDTLYSDRVEIKTLSEKVYYRVVAIDKNYNHSEYSTAVEIIKPDRMAPSAPVLSRALAAGNTVRIEWINSSSSDVAEHHLYRKEESQTSWDLVEVVPMTDHVSAAIDETVKSGKNYSYTILAVDRSKLESRPSNATTVKIPKEAVRLTGIRYDFKKETGELKITWDGREDVKYYWIYRSIDNESLSLYKKHNAVNLFIDKISKPGLYTYRIKVFFKNDEPAIFSEPTVVSVK